MKQDGNDKVSEILDDANYSETDPLGSWTGRPKEVGAVPVQDADDL